MAYLKSNDRCIDCKNCKIWTIDKQKASCRLYHIQGFNPERSVPRKCVNKVQRKF